MCVIEQAKVEMELAGFEGHDQKAMLIILSIFFEQWDSGGAVAAMAPVLQRLIAGKPLGLLTGAESEWFKPMDDIDCFQNRRCGSVFKEKLPNGEWFAYDIDGPDQNIKPEAIAHRWAIKGIEFPYAPESAEVGSPVVENG